MALFYSFWNENIYFFLADSFPILEIKWTISLVAVSHCIRIKSWGLDAITSYNIFSDQRVFDQASILKQHSVQLFRLWGHLVGAAHYRSIPVFGRVLHSCCKSYWFERVFGCKETQGSGDYCSMSLCLSHVVFCPSFIIISHSLLNHSMCVCVWACMHFHSLLVHWLGKFCNVLKLLMMGPQELINFMSDKWFLFVK